MTQLLRYILLFLSLGLAGISFAAELRLSAFNVKIFGRKKMTKPIVEEILPEIVRRGDITLIQEIRDNTDTAITELYKRVNGDSTSYALALSPALGRTRSKEKYAYFYHKERVQLVTSFVAADTEDRFEREPYVGVWRSREGVIFATVGIHAKPKAVDEELAALAELTKQLQKLGLQRILLMGDMNADCSYFDPSYPFKLPGLDQYVSLIDNDSDTTVSATDCAYDRFVASPLLERELGEAIVFDHGEYYNLTETETAAISDHYAIEVSWYPPQFY